MDIKELTKILEQCAETKSLDGLLKAAGVDEMAEGDSVNIQLCINREDGNVQLKLLRTDIDMDDMTVEELEAYYDQVECEYDDLENEEPDDIESDEHYEWEEKTEELEDLMSDIEDRITKLKSEEE
ncbi:MAG: hypothetical protein LUF82_05945 [Clostridia bacterium]|nr:hypothetical protein [Clostridia bacterium]